MEVNGHQKCLATNILQKSSFFPQKKKMLTVLEHYYGKLYKCNWQIFIFKTETIDCNNYVLNLWKTQYNMIIITFTFAATSYYYIVVLPQSHG